MDMNNVRIHLLLLLGPSIFSFSLFLSGREMIQFVLLFVPFSAAVRTGSLHEHIHGYGWTGRDDHTHATLLLWGFKILSAAMRPHYPPSRVIWWVAAVLLSFFFPLCPFAFMFFNHLFPLVLFCCFFFFHFSLVLC